MSKPAALVAYRIFAAFLLLDAAAWAGEREGHGGDPLLADFHRRGRFVLNEMRRTKALDLPALAIFAQALRDLRVELSHDPLPSAGRVLPDPDRPKQQFVLLDDARYRQFYQRRTEIDLNAFVAHEIFETGQRDFNYEWTGDLRFAESEYQAWSVGYAVGSSEIDGSNFFGAIAYSFDTGRWGVAWDCPNLRRARTLAQAGCQAADCQVVSNAINACLSLASPEGHPERGEVAWDASRREAERKVLERCSAGGRACEIRRTICSQRSRP